MPLNVRTDIHIFGENNLAFLSQIAFFRNALRRLYAPSEPIRIRCFLGGPEFDWDCAPAHVLECREDIEIITADATDYAARSFYAQCDHAFLDIREDADVVVFADADTFWMRRPDTLFEIVFLNNTAAGCMAHYPPPDGKDDPKTFWETQFAAHVGHSPDFKHSCSFLTESPSPFYVNFGFVAMNASLMRQHGQKFIELVNSVQKNSAYPYFSYQVAFTLLLAKLGIIPLSIPIKYNFPNDDNVIVKYNIEIEEIIVFHYLRRMRFDRESMFLSLDEFGKCISAHGTRADSILERILLDIYCVPAWLTPQRTGM